MIVSFCGHRDSNLEDALIIKLQSVIEDIIQKEKFITFYMGGYGSFDDNCLFILKKLKKKYHNFEIVFITPYLDSKYLEKRTENNLYDSTVYPPIEKTPKKFAIEKRNNFIVDKVDLLICYVEHKYGGAYKMFKRAVSKGVKFYNLAQ